MSTTYDRTMAFLDRALDEIDAERRYAQTDEQSTSPAVPRD
jgi:hypothetical protein